MKLELFDKILGFLTLTKGAVDYTANVATILGIAVALYGYNQWRKIHVNERESNSYLELKKKILSLKFLIDQLRCVQFLPANPREVEQMKPYFKNSKLQLVEKIQQLCIEILQELFLLEGKFGSSSDTFSKKEQKSSVFHKFKEKVADNIIFNITLNTSYYMNHVKEKLEEAITVLFPSEQNNLEPDQITRNALGQEIIMDDFGEQIDFAFKDVLSTIDGKIL